jgi:hypothetical protein
MVAKNLNVPRALRGPTRDEQHVVLPEKPPANHVEPRNVEALAMLAFGDLPHDKPKGGPMGLRAPLSFGFLLIVLMFVGLIVWAIILGPGQ